MPFQDEVDYQSQNCAVVTLRSALGWDSRKVVRELGEAYTPGQGAALQGIVGALWQEGWTSYKPTKKTPFLTTQLPPGPAVIVFRDHVTYTDKGKEFGVMTPGTAQGSTRGAEMERIYFPDDASKERYIKGERAIRKAMPHPVKPKEPRSKKRGCALTQESLDHRSGRRRRR